MPIKHVISDHKAVKCTFPASTAIAIGDLLWNNAGVAAKASAQTDQLSESANQLLFSSLFLGVSADQRLGGETATGERVVLADCIVDATCPSTTWALGDLVGPSEDSGGTFLENQQLERVTDPAKAIGYCILPTSSASTTVRARLISKYLPGDVRSSLKRIVSEQMTQTAVTDTATITAAQLLTKILDGTPTAGATYTLPTAALLVAALPGVAVGDSFWFVVNNKSGGANTITVAAGSGGTGDGTLTVAQNVIRSFLLTITNVTAASEAYFVYGIG